MEYVKLEPEIKEKWVTALRSGDYIQTCSILYDGSKEGKPHMCCLGVLENILGTPLEDMWDSEDYPDKFAVPNNLGHPKSIFGKNSDDGNEIGYTEHRLINMNDGNTGKSVRKHSFEEIADFIETNL